MLLLVGPSRTKRKRTGTGTSRTDSSSTASCSLTKAMVGCSRKSTLPERRSGEMRTTTLQQHALFPVVFSSPPLTDENDGGLCVLRDLLQQLQLVFGFGAMHPGHQDRLLLQDTWF